MARSLEEYKKLNPRHLIAERWLPVPHHIKTNLDGIGPAVVTRVRAKLANPQPAAVQVYKTLQGFGDHVCRR